MGKYLKQGFVRELEWQLAREEISHSKMVELMEEECIKNYKAEMTDRELGQFLNWFIRYYSTEITTDRGLLYYANAMGEEVSIAEIIEHYNREK